MKIPDNFSRENRIPVTFIWDFAVISVILRSKSLDFIIGISKKKDALRLICFFGLFYCQLVNLRDTYLPDVVPKDKPTNGM